MLNNIFILIQQPIYFLSYCALLGLLIGSFLNVVISRLPIILEQKWKENDDEKLRFNLSKPPSFCPSCRQPIKIHHNIPLISYLILRGKCAYCSAPIPNRYPIIEFITCVLSTITAYYFYPSLITVLAALVFTWFLIALSGIDYETYLLPDNLTLPLIWVGLIVNYFSLFTSLENALWGAVIGYISFYSVLHIFKFFTKKDGLGYGDLKLLSAIGAWLGWELLPAVILLASGLGLFFGLILIFRGQSKEQPISFGPYLAISAWVTMLLSDQVSIFNIQQFYF